jgi:O-antigen ligase
MGKTATQPSPAVTKTRINTGYRYPGQGLSSYLIRRYSHVFALADILLFVIMMGTFHATTEGRYRLVNQGFAVILILLYGWCHVRFRLRFPAEYKFLAVFVAWSWLSGLSVAVSSYWMVRYGIMITRYMLFAVAISGFVKMRRNAVRGFLVLLSMAVYVSYRLRTTVNINELLTGDLRLSQFGVNPNSVGLILLWGFSAIVFLWREFPHPVARITLAFISVFNLYALVSTASRKSFIGFLLFTTLWLLFCYSRAALKSTLSLFLVVTVVFGVYFILTSMLPGSQLVERLEAVDHAGVLDVTRTNLYREAWALFLAKPVTGVGLGNFMVYSAYRAYSHSEYAEVLSTTGIVGFVLYFSCYILLFRRIQRILKTTTDQRLKYQMGVFLALFFTMMAIGIGVPFFLSIYPWFLMALMIGYTSGFDPVRTKRKIPLPARYRHLYSARHNGRDREGTEAAPEDQNGETTG